MAPIGENLKSKILRQMPWRLAHKINSNILTKVERFKINNLLFFILFLDAPLRAILLSIIGQL
jgi:hypothetical protein